MSTISKDPPECFGVLAIVFPEGPDGLRHSPESCLACPSRVDCLRQAMQSEGGLQVQEKNLDKAYAAGLVGFWSRWSRKKSLHQQRKSGA